MSITKRGKDTWLVRIFLGRNENGKTRFFNETVRGKRKDAEIFETKKKRELDTGISIEHSKITVNEYLNRWLEVAAKPRLKNRSFEDYVEYARRYIRPAIGTKQLSKMRPLDIQAVYTEMLNRGLSPRTVLYTHAILTSALSQGVNWQIIPSNPAAHVDLPQNPRKEMKALSAEEARQFLEAAKGDDHSTVFSVAIASGMRPEEYLGLTWKDIDFDRGAATVRRALVWKRKGGGWSLQPPKTTASRRTIPLPSSVMNELLEHRKGQLEKRLKLGQSYQNLDFVFTTEIGTPIRAGNLGNRHFKPILKQAGLSKNIRLYDLRHTCATLLLLAKTSPKVVAERLGHSTVVLTLDTYSHVLPSMQKDATDELESMLFKTGSGF